jgi:CDGSH-type Zn-finger protein
MLIIYVLNFKAKREIQKRYSQSTNMCSCGKHWGKPFHNYYQL